MQDADAKTIELFAGRSDKTVASIAFRIAVAGALFNMAAHLLGAIFPNGGGVSLLWGMWIPLCFITIPPHPLLVSTCARPEGTPRRAHA